MSIRLRNLRGWHSQTKQPLGSRTLGPRVIRTIADDFQDMLDAQVPQENKTPKPCPTIWGDFSGWTCEEVFDSFVTSWACLFHMMFETNAWPVNSKWTSWPEPSNYFGVGQSAEDFEAGSGGVVPQGAPPGVTDGYKVLKRMKILADHLLDECCEEKLPVNPTTNSLFVGNHVNDVLSYAHYIVAKGLHEEIDAVGYEFMDTSPFNWMVKETLWTIREVVFPKYPFFGGVAESAAQPGVQMASLGGAFGYQIFGPLRGAQLLTDAGLTNGMYRRIDDVYSIEREYNWNTDQWLCLNCPANPQAAQKLLACFPPTKQWLSTQRYGTCLNRLNYAGLGMFDPSQMNDGVIRQWSYKYKCDPTADECCPAFEVLYKSGVSEKVVPLVPAEFRAPGWGCLYFQRFVRPILSKAGVFWRQPTEWLDDPDSVIMPLNLAAAPPPPPSGDASAPFG